MPHRGFNTEHLDLLTWLPVAVVVAMLMVMALSCWAAKHAVLWKRRVEEAAAIAGGKSAYVEADGGQNFDRDVKQASVIEVSLDRASGFESSPKRASGSESSPKRASGFENSPKRATDFENPYFQIPPKRVPTLNPYSEQTSAADVPTNQPFSTIPTPPNRPPAIDIPSARPDNISTTDHFEKHRQDNASHEDRCNRASSCPNAKTLIKILVAGEEFQMCSVCGNVTRSKQHVNPVVVHAVQPNFNTCLSLGDVTVSTTGRV
ncbi:uncharacterized protein LOC119577886 [Penaeus monodon]|uniref:uncharacterized protein LOC119577886 n=1 Tax=Penaeus monodon TaxID=6687 RepID=UPI0018A7D81A|nr:uncharacterized protein LOC119577886 [Penaeus monodon]